MKKFINILSYRYLFFIGIVSLTSCSSDDDNNSQEKKEESRRLESLSILVESKSGEFSKITDYRDYEKFTFESYVNDKFDAISYTEVSRYGTSYGRISINTWDDEKIKGIYEREEGVGQLIYTLENDRVYKTSWLNRYDNWNYTYQCYYNNQKRLTKYYYRDDYYYDIIWDNDKISTVKFNEDYLATNFTLVYNNDLSCKNFIPGLERLLLNVDSDADLIILAMANPELAGLAQKRLPTEIIATGHYNFTAFLNWNLDADGYVKSYTIDIVNKNGDKETTTFTCNWSK